jgi:hypothetical protein
MTSRRGAAEPGTGIAAPQQVGGDQGFSWAPIFPASGSGCDFFWVGRYKFVETLKPIFKCSIYIKKFILYA